MCIRDSSKLGDQHPAIVQYNKCMRGAGDTVRSIIISANSRLAYLENQKVLRLLSRDDLNLAELGTGVNRDEKTRTCLLYTSLAAGMESLYGERSEKRKWSLTAMRISLTLWTSGFSVRYWN